MKQIITKILDAAIRAPSGDNTQPWKIIVSDNYTTIELYNLPERDDSYINFNQTASHIAHGAVIENIVISSKHLGYHAQVNLFPNDKKNLVAIIELSATEKQEQPMYKAIFKRCTNRFQYKLVDISESLIEDLSASIKNIKNTNISLVYQNDRINDLSKELMINDSLIFEHKESHRFLFDKIRWNHKQVERTMDGMPVDTLGLNLIEKLSFPLLRFWGFVKTANYIGLSKIIGLKSWRNLRTSSMLGMVTVPGNDKVSFIQGGRAIQRVWLEATIQGLAFQPIIGLPLLINRSKQGNLNGFTDKHAKIIQHCGDRLPELFGINKIDTMLMGFRMGAGGIVTSKTKRKKVLN